MKNIAIKLFIIFLFSTTLNSQIIKQKTIFIKFEIDKNCQIPQKFFYEKENGIVFNYLYCINIRGRSFLWQSKSDTLPISKLPNYKFSSLESIEVLEKKWRVENKTNLIKKYGKLYPRFDKNKIFKTYLIEKINNSEFVIYNVKWRGEDITCSLDEVPPSHKNK
ncbi:MAG: hypothetical protein KA210_08655 [Bacteroidia bacterium]|nr:hypothetical protein [Bacteroidia bacterium]